MDKDGSPHFVSRRSLQSLLPGKAAVDALEKGFRSRARNLVREPFAGPPRSIVEHRLGDLLLMPATGPEGAGAKLVSVVPANVAQGRPLINGLYVLFSEDGLIPELLIDGAALTELRTAAVSALVARHLAPPRACKMVVFGAGIQARAHARTFADVLTINEVKIVASTPESATAMALIAELRSEGIAAAAARPEDLGQAELVCTCTTSSTPVFASEQLAPGAHVSAIGSYKPGARELDLDLLERALLVVETRDAASREAGEIVQALELGVLPNLDSVHDLADLVRGDVVRASPDQVSVFKSVGLPIEDLIIARAVADRLSERAAAGGESLRPVT